MTSYLFHFAFAIIIFGSTFHSDSAIVFHNDSVRKDTLKINIFTNSKVLEHMKSAAEYSQVLKSTNDNITAKIKDMDREGATLSSVKYASKSVVKYLKQAYENAEKMSNQILYAQDAANDAGCNEFAAVLDNVDRDIARVASKLASAYGRSGGMSNAISVSTFKSTYEKVVDDFNTAADYYISGVSHLNTGPALACPN